MRGGSTSAGEMEEERAGASFERGRRGGGGGEGVGREEDNDGKEYEIFICKMLG